MKKIIICLVLVFSFVFLMASCGLDVGNIASQLDSALSTLEIPDDPFNTDGPDNPDYPDNPDGPENTKATTGKQDPADDMAVLLPEEYHIVMKSTYKESGEIDENTVEFLKSKDGFTVGSGEDSLLYVFDGDMAYIMEYSYDEGMFMCENGFAIPKENALDTISLYHATLYNQTNLAKMTKKTSTTFLGRSCDVYAFEGKDGGFDVKVESYIDKATHVCLKYYGKTSGFGADVEVTNEIVTFETSGIKLPAHQGFAKSIKRAYMVDEDEEETNEFYVGDYYMVKAEFDTENAIGSFTVECQDDSVVIMNIGNINAVSFTKAGKFTIKVSGLGSTFNITCNVDEYPEEDW